MGHAVLLLGDAIATGMGLIPLSNSVASHPEADAVGSPETAFNCISIFVSIPIF